MKLVFLGTSGSIPTAKRGLPAAALKQKEELCSFDWEKIYLSLNTKAEYFHRSLYSLNITFSALSLPESRLISGLQLGEEVIRLALSERDMKIEINMAENSPEVVHWFMLGEHTRIYIDKSFLTDLINRGIQEAGSQRTLARKLSELGEYFDQPQIWRLRKGEYEGLTVHKLKALLRFFDIPYNAVDRSIRAIGGRRSIKNVRFPINMNCYAGGRLIAAALSDGGVYLRDLNQRKLVFNYYNNDRNLINQIIKSARDLVGEAQYSYNNEKLSFSSKLIPEILVRVGVPIGRKTLTNSYLPQIVCHGKPETVRGHFSQVFADEGSIWEGAIAYKRAIGLSNILSDAYLSELEGLHWKERRTSKGTRWKNVSYAKKIEKEISNGLRNLIWSNPPKLLVNEMDKLGTCGIKATIKPTEINKTTHGYTAVWTLQILGEENIKIFAEKIGFGCKRKQRKLEEMLERWRLRDATKKKGVAKN